MVAAPAPPGSFAVDLTDLDAVVADVASCERELTALAETLAREIALLHEAWSGLAADAQLAAQAEWDHGLAAMHAALTRLRVAARSAHDRYTCAARANVGDWSSVG